MVASFTRLIIIGLQLMCTVFCGSVLPIVKFGILYTSRAMKLDIGKSNP